MSIVQVTRPVLKTQERKIYNETGITFLNKEDKQQ